MKCEFNSISGITKEVKLFIDIKYENFFNSTYIKCIEKKFPTDKNEHFSSILFFLNGKVTDEH